jgi:multidrug efflux pump subunit AcrB
VLVGLLVTRTPFSVIMTGVGVIALVGIVVNNAIVLLDFSKQLRRQGVSLAESLVEAGRVRLRPVVLTAVATMLGVFPLATGIDMDWRAFHPVWGGEMASFWRPLGVAIIFGLGVSTFLTLIIVPIYYVWAEEMTARVIAWVRRLLGLKPKRTVDAEIPAP